MRYYLAIDIGASSGRHIVGWLEKGVLKTEEVYRFPNGVTELDGHLTWDIDALTEHVRTGVDKALERFGKIESLSVDTWGVDYVLLKGEEEVRPCYAYRDSRTEAVIPLVHEKMAFSELYRHTGIQFQPFNTIYQLYADKLARRLEGVTDFLLMPEYLTTEDPLHRQIEPIIRKLTDEPHYQRFHEELLIKARVFEILHRILPFCEQADSVSANEDIAYEKLKRSLIYIEEHCSENISVETVAAESNYSASHFAKLFRHLTGDSFTQYLKNYRLEMAAVRLRNEKTKISEIALSCGFPNLSYFSRAFLEKFGLTPSDYRKTPVLGTKSIDKEDALG